jgi:deoxyribose-phosphate aldolase
MDAERARLAISLVDLTNLRDDCDTAAVDDLCRRAIRYGTAAVCVWPDFVAQSNRLVDGRGVTVATVVNFPTGDERAFSVAVHAERALADGADEVDVVLPYRALVAGDRGHVAAVLSAVRSVTAGRAILKVILETGELPDIATVTLAAEIAIEHGADFIKTSTGKTATSATPPAAAAMLAVIARSNRTVGLKPSGGISTVADAETYLELAEAAMGPGWVDRSTFRFGASGLLTALVEAVDAGDPTGEPAGSTDY